MTLTSDMGVARELSLAEVGALLLEAVPREQVAHASLAAGGGCIRMTTLAHAARRHAAEDEVQCGHCGRFLRGKTALWWHIKTAHAAAHEEAVREAEAAEAALVPYAPPQTPLLRQTAAAERTLQPSDKLRPGDLERGLSAARNGDREVLEALIEAKRVRPLPDAGLEAARAGDVDGLRAAAAGGWKASAARDARGATALLWAAGGGHMAAVRCLVEELGVDPRSRNAAQLGRRSYAGRTALHWAARNGHLGVCRYLVVECGCEIDAATDDGTTALAWACWTGRSAVMRWLLESCAADAGACNAFGCTPPMWSAQGAATVPDLELLRKHGAAFAAVNANGHSMLHKAAQRGRRDVCEWLLASAMRCEALGLSRRHAAPDLEGFTPPQLARVEGHIELGKWLQARLGGLFAMIEPLPRMVAAAALSLEGAAGPRLAPEPRYPPTTFFGAVAAGDILLLERVLSVDEYYVTQASAAGPPLHVAASAGRVPMARHLLNRGAVVNQRDRWRMTALHRAAALLGRRHEQRGDLGGEEVGCAPGGGGGEASEGGGDSADSAPVVDGASLSKRQRLKLERKAAKRRLKAAYRARPSPTALATRAADDVAEAKELYAALLVAGADINARDAFGRLPCDLASGASDAVSALEADVVADAPSPEGHPLLGDWWALRQYGLRPLAGWKGGATDGHAADVAVAEGSPGEHAQQVASCEERRASSKVQQQQQPPCALSDVVCWEPDAPPPSREPIAGVPGAFLIRGALPDSERAALAAAVEAMQPPAGGDARAPRRAAHAEALRQAGSEEVAAIACEAPLSLLSPTDGLDGRPARPVEPVAWPVVAQELAPLCARLRPLLPATCGAAEGAGAPLAPPGRELSTFLRAYRYLPGTKSVAHFDKPSQSDDAISAYSVVFYLSEGYGGGETTFFRSLGEGGRPLETGAAATSRRRLTLKPGAPHEAVARVAGRAGDALVFPHGARGGCFVQMLHEGALVRGPAAKLLLRSDVMFTTTSG